MTTRRAWRVAHDLARLVTDTADPNEITIDMSTVMVLNEWVPVRFGHRDHADRELVALAERNRQRRTTRSTATIRRAA
jgi:hypothetical protein